MTGPPAIRAVYIIIVIVGMSNWTKKLPGRELCRLFRRLVVFLVSE